MNAIPPYVRVLARIHSRSVLDGPWLASSLWCTSSILQTEPCLTLPIKRRHFTGDGANPKTDQNQMNQLETRVWEYICITQVEPSMQMYSEDHCIDGPSSAWRRTTSVKLLMSIIVLPPMLSFSVLFLPLTAPEKGFHQNWVFNYLAHPALNYVVCRAELEIGLRRPLAPSDRPRIAWVTRWCPLIGCVATRHDCKSNERPHERHKWIGGKYMSFVFIRRQSLQTL